MKLKRDALLGMVFFGGLGLILWATVSLSRLSSLKTEDRDIFFPNARGLKEGDKVYVLGTQVGIVKRAVYVANYKTHPIRVTVEFTAMPSFREGYSIAIEEASFLGGKKISIEPGYYLNSSLKPDADLSGTAPPAPLNALGEFLTGGENKNNFATILSDLAVIIHKTAVGEGTLGRIINDPTPFDDLKNILGHLRLSIENEEKRGSLGKFIMEPELYDDVQTLAAEAKDVVHKLNTSESMLAKAIGDEELGKHFSGVVEDIAKVTGHVSKGEGMAGRILVNKDTEKAFDQIVTNVDQATAAINKGEGIVPFLLHNSTAKEAFASIVANINHVSKQLTKTDNTIGRLLNDDALIADVERIVANFSRTIEDAREAAPVQTLFSTFGGVFQ